MRLFISSNIMGILNSTTDKKSTLNQCIIYYMCISRTYPKYLPHARPTQPKKKQSLALSRKTLEPVHLLSSGLFEVADEDTIIGPSGVRITKSKVLLGYILAQYIDGDDEEPTRSDCIDLYMENAIDKLKSYVFKLQQLKHIST
jgi:hypothetical protein